MTDLIWKDVSTLPKDGRVVIAKDSKHREFSCRYGYLPDSIGYYSYLEIEGYPRRVGKEKQAYPTHWRNT